MLQLKAWLHGISPMVWRRLLVPGSCTLHGLHSVIQVAMGWEGFHLYQFSLRSRRYGSWELAASSPDVTLATLRLPCAGLVRQRCSERGRNRPLAAARGSQDRLT